MAKPLKPPPATRGVIESDSEDAPEALFISALLESGAFTPDQYHVTSDQVVAWSALYEFCLAYQQHAGQAPPDVLIRRRFPEFTATSGVSVAWAADQVRKAASTRELRTSTREMLGMLADEDLEGAFDVLESIRRPMNTLRSGVSVFDEQLVVDEDFANRIDVPYNTLRVATRGGIGASEFWILAARLGQGKTWEAINYAALAAKLGNSVAIASLEMPAIQVQHRALMRLAGRDQFLAESLRSEEIAVRKEAITTIEANTPGTLRVYDPSRGQVNTLSAIRDLCSRYDLVIVDHLGLMMDNKGRRAIEDWRVQAEISNVLREISLASKSRIVGLVQINRAGENRGSARAPGADNLAGSDALGQDADVVITMKRLSTRVMVHSGEKVREGPNIRWWTRFDPGHNRFEEITKQTALDLSQADDDRLDEV